MGRLIQNWIRNALYSSVLLIGLPWLLWRSFKTGRYREGLSQKLLGIRNLALDPSVKHFGSSADAAPQNFAQTVSQGERPKIWLHGVSVGEVQLLVQLINYLLREFPNYDFAFSTTTESGMELAEQKLNAVDWKEHAARVDVFYFPFDFSWAVKRTLKAVDPNIVVLGELELWPTFIAEASHQEIPIVVANGRLSAKSFKGYKKFRRLTRGMFEKLACVAAQNEEYAERFVACGCNADRVSVTGSLKFDNVAFSPNDSNVHRLRQLVGLEDNHTVWLVGSTQSPEEEYALQTFTQTRREHPDLKLIVVPRHPDRFADVKKQLVNSQVKLAVRSELAESIGGSDWEVLLVDTVGELRWWWGVADLALVGGSFGSRGGQNMIEPAAFGSNVAFGPNTSNFKDVTELLLRGDAATRIASLDAIAPWLENELSTPKAGKERGERAKALVRQQQGATERTIRLLRQLIPAEANRAAA